MIQVYEIDYNRANRTAQKFGTVANKGDRFFIMEEEGEIGYAAISLEKGVVLLKEIITDRPFGYYDLLARSTLNVLRNLPQPITVQVSRQLQDQNAEYFYRFGFEQKGDILQTISSNIDLSGTCKGEK